MAKTKTTGNKKKQNKSVFEGNIYIQATFNNTIITATDRKGNTLAWASAGALGFKGAKKSTPYAAQSTAESLIEKIKNVGLQDVHIFVKGPGMGRESAIRSLGTQGLSIRSIHDVTPIPHNGCRPSKSRRP